jgi:hypothetical protein
MGRFSPRLSAPHVGFLVTLSLALGACQVAEPVRAAAPAEIVQWSGAQSSVTAATQRVLRDQAEWHAFWPEVRQTAPRAFDPAREMAVAVFLGERRSGGYTVRFVSAEPHDGQLVVTYQESAPPPGSMVTQALTYPWTLAVLPRSPLPVRFRPAQPTQPSPAQK